MTTRKREDRNDDKSYQHEITKRSKLQPIDNVCSFSEMPREILLHIFSYVDADTLLNVGGVSRQWRSISSENNLWEERFGRATIQSVDSYSNKLKKLSGSWKDLYLQELLCLSELQGEREIVIFQEMPRNRNVFHTVMQWFSLSEREQGIHGEVPYFLRHSDFFVEWVKWEQREGRMDFLTIQKIPIKMKWKIRQDSFNQREWIEEKHRKWKEGKDDDSGGRKRKVIIDLNSTFGLRLSPVGLDYLRELTECHSTKHLERIPRDHPALVQVVCQMGEMAGKNLRVVSIPIDCEWFIASKGGREYVSEAFHRWPVPSPVEMEEMPFVALEGNRLVNKMIDRQSWEEEKRLLEGQSEDEQVEEVVTGSNHNSDSFASLTEHLEEKWK